MRDFIFNLFKKVKLNNKIEKLHPKFWKSDCGDIYLNFGEYGQEIEVACFSPNGSRVLCVKDVSNAEIFDVETGRKVGSIKPTSPLEGSKAGPTSEGFKVFIESAVLNQSGSMALLGLNDGTAGLFDVETGERLSLFHHPDIPPASCWSLIKAVAFSNDYKMVLVGFYGRSVGIWDVETKEMKMFLKSQHADKYFSEHSWGRNTLVSSISVSNDNRYIFAGYSDMTAEIWDVLKQESVFSAFRHCENVNALHQYKDSLIWATSGGNIYITELFNNCVHTVWQFKDTRSRVVFHKDRFLCVKQNYEVGLGNFNGEYTYLCKLDQIVGCANYEKDIGFLNDGSYYYPTDKLTIRFKMPKDEKLIQIDKDAAFPASAILSPSGKYIVVCSDRKAGIISLESFGNVSECNLKKRMYPMCMTEDDRFLIVKNEDYERDKNSIYFWDVQKGKFLYALKGDTRIIQFVTFSPSLKYFISADCDKTVLWEMNVDESKPPVIISENKFPDIDSAVFLDEDRILIIGEIYLELWNGLREKLWSVKIPFMYNRKYILSSDKRNIRIGYPFNQVADIDLSNGACKNTYGEEIPRPHYCGQGYRWDGPGGPYLHQGEGPRGWITPQSLSKDRKLVVLQHKDEVILASFDEKMEILLKKPFKGRLRASCIIEGKVLLLDNEGKITQMKEG